MPEVVVVGAGHNGLIAGCYLARAGASVLVLEAQADPGGGSRTAETVPGFRFDLHSVAHNMINMTDIPSELELDHHGLEYLEMDPFSVAVRTDGHHVRYHRSVDETVESIAQTSAEEADAYRRFVDRASPIIDAVLPAVRGRTSPAEVPGRLGAVVRALRRAPLDTIRDVLGPYESLLLRSLPTDRTRASVAAFAAHAGVGPSTPGGALFALWQAAYHRFGQWHARGGAQGLIDALVSALRSAGGELRCAARVRGIEAPHGRVRAVVTATGERIACDAVVTAIDPKLALLELLSPPLDGAVARDLAAARRGNVVQAVVHVATDRLPPYPGAQTRDWHGLQSYVDRLEDLVTGWRRAEAGLLPDPIPLYAFTTSAIDDTLAPADCHTVYLACPCAPFALDGGWDAARDRFVDGCLRVVEEHAPGFRATIRDVAVRTPDRMATEEGWPGAHPMHLDITLDQLGPFRPIRRLGRHRTPVTGLFICGAGTNPSGGILGTPGRMAARAAARGLGLRPGGNWMGWPS
jgi:phytoene dehydrogenase-like protein